jgi:hypothetical protein
MPVIEKRKSFCPQEVKSDDTKVYPNITLAPHFPWKNVNIGQ